MGFFISIKRECFVISSSLEVDTHKDPAHFYLTSLTLRRAFKCLPIMSLHLPQSYFICSDLSWSWLLTLARDLFIETVMPWDFSEAHANTADSHLWNIRSGCCCYAATHLSLLPVVAVAVTVSTMTTQVPPTPPLVTLSVRWWNVTLMVIPQVSNFELHFHKVHVSLLVPVHLHSGKNTSPNSLNQIKVLFHCSLALRWKCLLYSFNIQG